MLQGESESKTSRRGARQSIREGQPKSAGLKVFLSEADADALDVAAEASGMSVSAYLRILVAKGREALMAESEARAAAAEARLQPPENAHDAQRRLAEEGRLLAHRDAAQAKAIRRGTIQHGRKT